MFYTPLKFTPDNYVLLETDICEDVDDVGALALLLGESRRYGFKIAGISINCHAQDSVAAVTAIIRSRGFTDIPIGVSALQQERQSKYLADVAALLPEAERGQLAPLSSEELYKKVLETVPDHSLTIVSIGFLQVMDKMWHASSELFERKVENVIIMGGSFLYKPGYREYNIVAAYRENAEDFVVNYPGKTIFIGFELGCDIYTDLSPMADNMTDPAVMAYRLFSAAFNNGVPNYRRKSWDPITVDFAVHGEGARYRLSPSVELQVTDGVFHFKENPAATRAFVIPVQDNDTIGQYLSRQILADIPQRP